MEMQNITIPKDAFSHGQIQSKIWLAKQLDFWLKKHATENLPRTLTWLGSWVGVGPFLILSNLGLNFRKINLYDLVQQHLNESLLILDYWRCEGVEINLYPSDINECKFSIEDQQLFVNTACEHIVDNRWLGHLPKDSLVVLQSTNMPHSEHINSPKNLDEFIEKYSGFLMVLESEKIDFVYPDKEFSRFMLFGKKL